MSGQNTTLPLSIVERIFSNWTALKLVVEHGMGTSNQAHDFCEYIVDTLAMNEKLDDTDIAAAIEDYMDTQFRTQLEDNSEMEVAQEIIRFHKIFLENDADKLESEIATLPGVQSWIKPNQVPAVSCIIKNDEAEKPSKNNTMEVDDEGFTLVPRRRK